MNRRYPVAVAVVGLLVLAGCTDPEPDGGLLPSPTATTAAPGGNAVPLPLVDIPRAAPNPLARLITGNDGIFSVNCPYSHSLPDDPIVLPGHPGHAHLHDFACNRGTNALSTVKSLVAAAEGTTADQPGDTSAVWWPTLYQNGVALVPKAVFTYYDASVLTNLRPFPTGLTMIAGDAGATGPQDSRVTSWGCVGEPKTAGTPLPPDTCPTLMALRINFPNCMKSTLDLDSADHKSHMAYSWVDGTPAKCPASHPVGTVALDIGVRWEVPEPHGTLTLSSGDPRGAHADYIHSWDQRVFTTRFQNCIVAGVKCGTRQGGIG